MSVTAPEGFDAAGVAAGIRKDGRPDLALVAARTPVPAAAVFTTNAAAAAPVVLSRRHLAAAPHSRAVVLNSGCANAGTGAAGLAHAEDTASAVAAALSCRREEVLVCSTGAIGPALPRAAVLGGVAAAAPTLTDDAAAARQAALAIMTTDTVPKEVVVAGAGYTVGGMAKGAGMVRPDMATMLAVITTDAVVDAADLDRALREAVDLSFNSLNLDGCPSTNDAVIALASGASGVAPPPDRLTDDLTRACVDLSRQMAEDVEGAGRVVTVEVVGARDEPTARALGRVATDSALVRTAFYGGDPNWGRLLGAIGAAGLPFDPDAFGVAFQGITVAAGGVEAPFDRATLAAAMKKGPLDVTVRVGAGPGSATVLSAALTPEYVVFNGEYS